MQCFPETDGVSRNMYVRSCSYDCCPKHWWLRRLKLNSTSVFEDRPARRDGLRVASESDMTTIQMRQSKIMVMTMEAIGERCFGPKEWN